MGGVDVIGVDTLQIDTKGACVPYVRNKHFMNVTTNGRSKNQISGSQKYSHQFLRKHEKLELTAEGRLCCVIAACVCCGSKIMKFPPRTRLLKKFDAYVAPYISKK